MVKRKCLAALALVFLLVAPGYGDGDGRQATAEEREFYRLTQELLAAALPAEVPEGWEITDQTELEELELVTTDGENVPMLVEYGLQWTNIAREQQGQEQALAVISATMETSPVSDAQIAEYEELAAKLAEAAAAGDSAVVQQLQPQLEARAAAINSALASVDEKIRNISQSVSSADTRVAVRAIGNMFSPSLDSAAQQIDIAGYPAFQRAGYRDGDGEWHEAVTWILLGNGWFAPPGGGVYRFAVNEKASPLSLQTVVVMIEADPARTEEIATMIDWQSLQAMLVDSGQ